MERNKRTIWGTPNYIAPEVLSSKIGHSYEVDLWSLGVIAYTMLFGRPPFETRDVKVTYRKIKHNNYTFPTHVQVSESSKSFIRSLLRTDPTKRMNLDEIMKHEFFTYDYPERLPVFTLLGPPTSAYMSQFTRNPDEAPKPGVTPAMVPDPKDIATFECDLIDNDDAQILSNRQASVQTHRRIESQEKFSKLRRPKDTISNDRENFISTDKLYFNQGLGKGLDSSPYCSPKKGANYLHINLAKFDDKEEDSKAEYLKWNNLNKPFKAYTANNSGKKSNIPLLTEPAEDDARIQCNLFKESEKVMLTEANEEIANPEPEQFQQKPKSRTCFSNSYIHCPQTLVKKWIDYSSKYGIGYMLSNNRYGVLFNDSTKIVVSKDNYQFYYLKRDQPKEVVSEGKI